MFLSWCISLKQHEESYSIGLSLFEFDVLSQSTTLI